jgi:hypothetical protein
MKDRERYLRRSAGNQSVIQLSRAGKEAGKTRSDSTNRTPASEEESFVFIDAPVNLDPSETLTAPLVGPGQRWPLPPLADPYFYRFWHPNIRYRAERNGGRYWWHDYAREDGTWFRMYWKTGPRGNLTAEGGYQLPSVKIPGRMPEKNNAAGEDPEHIDFPDDFETMFGKLIKTAPDVEISGWRGYAELYADRTVVLYPSEGTQFVVFRPHRGGSSNAFRFYLESGFRTIIIVVIDIPKVFYK